MNNQTIEEKTKDLFKTGKGLLAADESTATCEKRFSTVGIACNENTRREYRELLLTTQGADEYLSGVILYEETFWQSTDEGQVFREYLKNHRMQPGIKVDKGLIDLPGFADEKISQGLDGLPEHMATYAAAGAIFAKWRSLITIGKEVPTREAIEANAFILARYARICQDYGVVPIVEPEVLYEGKHSMDECEKVMVLVYKSLFDIMRAYRVHMPGTILKTSMVLPGKESGEPIDADKVAERTIKALTENVPKDLGGVVFLSGGQTPRDAFINLNRIAKRGPHPWPVTFSYSRALQDPVLKAWSKNQNAMNEAQTVFRTQLQLASSASKGELDEATLRPDNFTSEGQDA